MQTRQYNSSVSLAREHLVSAIWDIMFDMKLGKFDTRGVEERFGLNRENLVLAEIES